MALDLVSVSELTPHLITRILLSPTLWEKFPIATPTLKWEQKKFSRSNISKIPKKRGVYAFLIRNGIKKASWPSHGYIMYVGIAGRRGAERTLRERFSEYLTPSEVAKRPKIARLVETWGDHLFFNYCVVSRVVNLEKLETRLLGAIVPPCNRADLPAEIKAAVNAFL